jgi:hypothetical protein
MRSWAPAVVLVLLASACTPKSIALGSGAPPDARLIADLHTWECSDSETDELYEGVFAYYVSLEYSPDGLADRDLPASGCSRALDIFPADAGTNGVDIPDADDPTWETDADSGVLNRQSTGFYQDDVFDNNHGCEPADELLGAGVTLSDAGAFSGAGAPAPGTFTDATLSGDVDEETGITFGAEVTATWEAEGWDSSWVQIRRERGGALLESVTCNTTGTDTFTVDDDVWSLLSEEVAADVTNVYVAVQNEGDSTASDGQELLSYTRAMHVAVVQD